MTRQEFHSKYAAAAENARAMEDEATARALENIAQSSRIERHRTIKRSLSIGGVWLLSVVAAFFSALATWYADFGFGHIIGAYLASSCGGLCVFGYISTTWGDKG